MSILINSAITALDTPSSLLPFFVKDAFDVTGRTVMANKEGGKHEAREKFIEEAGTSAFWIGGIPLVRFIGNKLFKNKFNSDIDFKRINSDGVQGYFAKDVLETVDENGKKVVKNKFSEKDLSGIVHEGGNLEKIKAELKNKGFKVNESKGLYKKYHVGLTAASVLINLAILTVGLPKFNQFLSRKIIANEMKEKQQNNKMQKPSQASQTSYQKPETVLNKTSQAQTTKPEVEKQSQEVSTNKNKPSFGSIKDFFQVKSLFNFEKMAENAQLNVQSSMLLLDYGISGSRVTFVPRDNNERIEYAVKEGGIILFFYFAADIIKSGLAKLANKVFKTPIDLDYKIVANKDFVEKLKHPKKKEELLNFVQLEKNDKNAELKVIKFIDEQLAKVPKNPANKKDVFENFTLKAAQEDGLIKIEYDKALERWVRDSKKYIQTDKIIELNDNLKAFCESTFNSVNKHGKTIDNVIAKTKGAKIASIIANIGICCASLSYFLPKLQYMVREHRTDTKQAPGIKLYEEMAQKNEL